MTIRVELAGIEQIKPLRAAVLRPGLPPERSDFPDDADVRCGHLAAFDDSRVVGVATVFPSGLPVGGQLDERGTGQVLFRLRGMATDPDYRGQGIGAQLLAGVVQFAADSGGTVLWCNARTSASGFYARHGFEAAGDEFEAAGVGPHYVMWREV